MPDLDAATPAVLRQAADYAIDYRASVPTRRVGARPGLTSDELRAALGGPLPEAPRDPRQVVDELIAAVEPGLVTIDSPRYFGFVMGGSVPAALAADILTTAWDQNAGLYLATPAAAMVEEVAGEWLVELLGLPAGTAVGFTTGATMAHFVTIAAARHAVLRNAGWDVEEQGLQGAPEIRVVLGKDAHVSLFNALRMVGLGRGRAIRVATDDEGRMITRELRAVLAELPAGPTIVCAQAGEVNTGAFAPIDAIADAVAERPGTWLHVDGAFGLWAAVVPSLRHLVAGVERADSWATDAHKWLNVPYDSGLALVRDVAALRAAMGVAAAYLPPAPGAERDPFDYAPEMSRRARGFPVYAALRSLGRAGIAEIVERNSRVARQIADGLAAMPGVRVINEVVLNQVLARFDDSDEVTRDLVRRIQDEGTAWFGGTTYHGTVAIRISVSNWATTEEDGARTLDAIARCLAEARAARDG
ncbi:MAG: aspartate aminotransferase family protein [Chloroflexi bacterium]|nr:aspartate aminotransferase family protein [Chloroflexota bacterium]